MFEPDFEPVVRCLTDYIVYWRDIKRYFFYWCGDEILMKASNDAEALEEEKTLQKKLEEI